MVRRNRVRLLFVVILLATGCEFSDDHPVATATGAPERSSSGSNPTSSGINVVPDHPTFNAHVAPIVFANCAKCHRPGESAPFSLLGYDDVKKRSQQIMDVIESRFMPPWLPEPGYANFADLRYLTDIEQATLRRWVEQGQVEGDPRDLPATPEFTVGWQLGVPDLILRPSEPYTVPLEGTDEFRNFVLSNPLNEARYVKAIEFRPGNPRVVHHIGMKTDDKGIARKLDAEDAGSGFRGMQFNFLQRPSGQTIGWLPGRQPFAGYEGVAWKLDPGTDIILLLHVLPSGKPEKVYPSLGLFFADEPPTKHPVMLGVNIIEIDISPGDARYTAGDSFKLPIDVDVLHVLPHAHYLCREMKAIATLPDGERRWLLYIKQWDFNWQDSYRFQDPVFLPQGTVISTEYTFDNSSDNPRNPSHPPARVTSGWGSRDEMGELWLQLLARNPDQTEILEQAAIKHSLILRLKTNAGSLRRELESDPNNAAKHERLGRLYVELNEQDDALVHFQHAVRIQPDLVHAQYSLGRIFLKKNELEKARQHLVEAIRIDESLPEPHLYLGIVYHKLGQLRDSQLSLTRSLEIAPDNPVTHFNLAQLYKREEKALRAMEHYRRAIELSPQFIAAHVNIASLLAKQGRWDIAESHFRKIVSIKSDDFESQLNLGTALAKQTKWEDAARHFRKATELRPESDKARSKLSQVQRELRSRPGENQ